MYGRKNFTCKDRVKASFINNLIIMLKVFQMINKIKLMILQYIRKGKRKFRVIDYKIEVWFLKGISMSGY